jgi:hypothetical protein
VTQASEPCQLKQGTPHEGEVDDWVEKAVLDTSLPLIPLIFSFVTPITGLNRPNTGKEDDDDCFDILFPLELFCAGNSQGIVELLRE